MTLEETFAVAQAQFRRKSKQVATQYDQISVEDRRSTPEKVG